MGDLRPLHRFHSCLSRRAQQGGRRADPQPRARHGRRRHAGFDLPARCASQCWPSARQAATRWQLDRPLRSGVGRFSRSVAPRLSRSGRKRTQALCSDRRPCTARHCCQAHLGHGRRAPATRTAHQVSRGTVSDEDRNSEVEVKSPRETTVLFGHAQPERALLEAYKSGRTPHAWLIGGAPGIGKATLAFRFARFVLAYPEPQASKVQNATSLEVDAGHPVARRVAAQAQGDLLVLERVVNEQTGKLYTVIRVDDVRRAVPFFGSTAGEGGWRIAIVDKADELQYPQGFKPLLQILEEAAGAWREAAAAADGSVARALSLLGGPALALRQRVLDLFAQLPEPDPSALHALGDALAGNEPQTLAAFLELVNDWLSARLSIGTPAMRQMARTAEIWEKGTR